MKILLVYGSGGHTEQAKRLYAGLKVKLDHAEFSAIRSDDAKQLINTELLVDELPTKYGPKYSLGVLRTMLLSSTRIYSFICKTRPDVIISLGPGLGILPLFIGALIGVKCIHVESWARHYRFSSTSRIVRYFSTILVQNRTLEKRGLNSILIGRL